MYDKLNILLDFLLVHKIKYITFDELSSNCNFEQKDIDRFIKKKMLVAKDSSYYCVINEIYTYAKRIRDQKKYDEAITILEKIYKITLNGKFLNQIFKINILNNNVDEALEIFKIIYPPKFFDNKKISLPFLYLYLLNNIKSLPKEYEIYINVLFNQDDYLISDYIDNIVQSCIIKDYDKALKDLNKVKEKTKKHRSKVEVLKCLIQMNIEKTRKDEDDLYVVYNIYDKEEILIRLKELNISNLEDILDFSQNYNVDIENSCLYYGLGSNQIDTIINLLNSKEDSTRTLNKNKR